jgi:drug/metabolite transporter (DMT)-like permease
MAKTTSAKTAAIIILGITVLWAGTFVFIKEGVSYTSPMLFVGFRFGIAALLFLPFSYKQLRGITPAALKDGFILSFLFFLGFSAQTAGLQYTTATKSAFITGTFVVFTPIFQTVIERKIPKKANIIGIILVFIGILLLSSQGNSITEFLSELGETFNIGDLLTLLCAIFFALYMVYMDIISPKYNERYLTFMQIAVTAVLGFLFAGLLDVTSIQETYFTPDFTLLAALLYTAIFASVIATLMQTTYQRYITPTKAAIIISVEPIFAAVIAYFVLQELLSFLGIIGALFIFGGLLISEFIKEKNE